MSDSARNDAPGQATSAPLVLFVCAHGAAKSVLAAAVFGRLAKAAGLAIDAQAASSPMRPLRPRSSTSSPRRGDW